MIDTFENNAALDARIAELIKRDELLFGAAEMSLGLMENWCKMDFWTIEEFIALTLNKSPKMFEWKKIQGYRNSIVVREYWHLMDLLKRTNNDPYNKYYLYYKGGKPANFLRFAKEKKFKLTREI